MACRGGAKGEEVRFAADLYWPCARSSAGWDWADRLAACLKDPRMPSHRELSQSSRRRTVSEPHRSGS
jgi:hypothetical protein